MAIIKGIVFVNLQEATLKQIDDIQKNVLRQLGNPKDIAVVVTPGAAYFTELEQPSYSSKDTKDGTTA